MNLKEGIGKSMNKGISYHIITIVAIFTSLGIGIFIGSMLNGEKFMMNQQSRLITHLEENLKIQKQENSQLKTQIGQLSKEISHQEKIIMSIYNNDEYGETQEWKTD
jgi:hypothetical protein